MLLFRSDRCCSAPAAQVWPLRCSLQHDRRMASQPHATSEALFYLVRAGLPHSPRQKDPRPTAATRARVRCLASPPTHGCNSPSEAEVYSVREGEHGAGGRGLFPRMLPTARTREIPGARDAEQWAEELDQSSPDGELSRRT